jgi:glycosyltransferase involved in cell wall biosynthesis
VLTFDPWPVRSGTTRRLDALVRALGEVTDLTVLVAEADVSTVVPDLGTTRVLKVRRDRDKRRSLVGVLRHSARLRPVTAAFHDRRVVREAIAREISAAPPDLVFTHQIGGPELLRGLVDLRRVVLDADTVDPRSFRRIASDVSGLARAPWLLDSVLLGRWLRRLLPEVGAVSVVSEADEELYLALAPSARVLVVPNGVDVPDTWTAGRADGRLLFVGTMQYPPNRSAVEWLAREMLPLLPEEVVDVVGPGDVPPHRQVRARGYVEELEAVWAEACALVVPLRAGGGTRLKVLEAMAHGLPVVSTALGVEGLPVEPGVHYLLAETGEQFAAACTRLREDISLREALSTAGRELSLDFAWQRCTAALVEYACRP